MNFRLNPAERMIVAWKFSQTPITELRATATKISRAKTMIASPPAEKAKISTKFPQMQSGGTVKLSAMQTSHSKYVENFHGAER